MNAELDDLLPELKMRPPSSSEEMATFLAYAGDVPQKDYLEFMRRHNGGDGPVGNDSYLRIWTLDSVAIRTEDSGASEFAPGLLLFGGDGGDLAYAFDRQDPQWPIVSVSLTSMSRDEMKKIAGTFSEFISKLAEDKI
jgi:hypothetical protein